MLDVMDKKDENRFSMLNVHQQSNNIINVNFLKVSKSLIYRVYLLQSLCWGMLLLLALLLLYLYGCLWWGGLSVYVTDIY